MSAQLWPGEETQLLISQSQNGDKCAREALMTQNSPLVRSIIRRYLGRGVEYDDLFQIGNIGLLKAIAGFDASFGVRFSTYAVPLIHGELKRFMRDNTMVKMPRSLKETQQKIRYCRQQLSVTLGREPGVNEIAEALKLSIDDVLLTLESMNSTVSLDEPAYDGSEATVVDLLEAKQSTDALDLLALRQCILQLSEREQKIIFLRYYKSLTQSKIAEILGISQVQISRIEARAIQKLRIKMK